MTTEEVVERFADARPGFVLASYAEVGLPFYRIRMRLQVLERKAVGPLEEFSLRAVDAGIDGAADMEAALGLDTSVLQATLVGLIESEALALDERTSGGGERLRIGARGKDMLAHSVQIIPRERVVDIDFDGLLRVPTAFVRPYLEPRELKDQGVREIPPHPPRRPDETELRAHVPLIEEVIRSVGDAREQLSDVLAVRGIERRMRIFQPAVALVYKPEGSARSQAQVAFAVGNQLSERHAQVFAEAGLAHKLGIAKRGIEDARKLATRVFGEEIADQLREAAPRPTEGAPPTTTKAPSAAAAVRPVQTYEHPTLLTEALETSEKRLLLISPWLRRGVINDAFLAKLKAALERGVVVYLGWGMSASETDSPDADSGLVKELEEVAKGHDGFRFERLGRTHAKVLVCDSRFVVVTSFNWLSFRGDPKRTFRDERGTLVSIPEYVDGQFAEWRSRFQ